MHGACLRSDPNSQAARMSAVNEIRAVESKIKVLVVDDHPLVIEGIKSSLQKQSRFVVVGEAANGLEAIQKARALKPDVVVMDISMPVMNGLEAASLLLETNPKVEVV